MNKTNRTIAGWILLVAGLLIISMTLYSSFNIFTGKKSAPRLFAAPEISTTQEAETETQQVIQEKLEQIIPSENITKLLNLISWSLLAMIFLFGGSKVSAIGVRLVKG